MLNGYTGRMMTADLQIPRNASASGLRIVPTGTHLSSTLKLEELRGLLARRPVPATVDNYRDCRR